MKVSSASDRIQPPGLDALVRRRLRSQAGRSHRIAPAWPRVVICSVGLAISVCSLLAIAYVVGEGQPNSSEPWRALTVTIAKPAVALGLGAALVLFTGACLRRIWLERLVRLPGPILVRELSVPSDLSDVDVAALTTSFRKRLQQLRLQAPTSVPGAIPAQNFLEMLDCERLDAKNPLVSVASIMRAAVPTHAYEVSAALVARASLPDGARYRVTAEVTRLPHEVIPIETQWATSCEDAVIQAADIVTAAVLPRTRLSDRPPWSGWRRYVMDSLVVHHFECAEKLTSERRYDEALDKYTCALELDPKNVDIRLHQAFVQEKVGLFLDALATYAGARRIANETSPALYRFRARRNRKASWCVACYRMAVLLAGADVAHQWRKPEGKTQTLRHEQRRRLRARLKPEVIELLRDHKLIDDKRGGRSGEPQRWKESEITRLLDAEGKDDEASFLKLRDVLAQLSIRMLEPVRLKVRRPWAPRTSLSPLCLDLTVKYVELRDDWVKHRLAQLASTTKAPWSPSIPEGFIRKAKFSTWPERYSAACLYALPLHVRSERVRAMRHDLVAHGVEQLELAMSSATSWYVASRRDWVLSEDPDLGALRQSDEFKHFETIYFPSASQTPERPADVHRWEQSRYTNELLAETARRWERVWLARREELPHPSDPQVVCDWRTVDAEAWELVRSLAGEYRYWHVRHELIERMARWGARYGFEQLEVGIPRLESRRQMSQKPTDEITHNETRLRHVSDEIKTMAGADPHLGPSKIEVRGRDAWRLQTSGRELRYLCDVHAALWRALHEWIDDIPRPDEAGARRRFKDTAAQARSLSRGSGRTGLLDGFPRRLQAFTTDEAETSRSGATGQNGRRAPAASVRAGQPQV